MPHGRGVDSASVGDLPHRFVIPYPCLPLCEAESTVLPPGLSSEASLSPYLSVLLGAVLLLRGAPSDARLLHETGPLLHAHITAEACDPEIPLGGGEAEDAFGEACIGWSLALR